jgi:predicted protein tyrosine phosphatase
VQHVLVSALAGGRLAADVARFTPTHVLSILDPGHPPPVIDAIEHVVMSFEDSVLDAPGGFGPEQVDALVGLAQRAQAHPGGARLIAHCHHGQSRSPAALFVMLAATLGPGEESVAFRRARMAAGGRPWPNRRMVLVADERLQRGGALVRELDAYRERFRT